MPIAFASSFNNRLQLLACINVLIVDLTLVCHGKLVDNHILKQLANLVNID
jgi:hypothetical protein